MKIFYISNMCSPQKFLEFSSSCIVKPEQASQKFNFLLFSGLFKIHKDVTAISTLPVNRTRSKEIWFKGQKEIYEGMKFIYSPIINFPIFKHIFNFIFVCFILFKNSLKNKDIIYICDALNLTSSLAVLFISKILRGKTIAILTDVPSIADYDSFNKSFSKRMFRNIYNKITEYTFDMYNAYIFLTLKMNELINKKNKLYIIVEGLVDIKQQSILNTTKDKYEKKIIIYAGALREKYGVDKLIRAFIKVKNKEAELWFYGLGELEPKIKEYQINDKRIKYFGMQPNHIVEENERKATLLVNPRPTKEKFTAYSFPSKNMEYMVSGTPVLTTKLAGIPEEYLEHVYLFEDESIQGFIKTIEKILEKNKEELYDKGSKAKEFVLLNKNNIEQAKKVITLINSIKK